MDIHRLLSRLEFDQGSGTFTWKDSRHKGKKAGSGDMSGAIPYGVFERINEAVEDAKNDAAESHRGSMNSYGAGYDAGYLAGLKAARAILEGVDE